MPPRPLVARPSPAIKPVDYRPPAGYAYDVELYPAEVLRERARAFDALGVERVAFHCVILVTSGRYAHTVDFENYRCPAGSVLCVRAGQSHRFGPLEGWSGWLLVFRAESVAAASREVTPAALELTRHFAEVPTLTTTRGDARAAIEALFARMAKDASTQRVDPLVNGLLRRQVETLLLRLRLASRGDAPTRQVESSALQRFRRYQAMVEREHARWHGVGPYASRLGCSEKTLNRATRAVVGQSAKAMLLARIVLEAKRRLVHSIAPVSTIAADLGFDEPSNFVKLFRRETGTTPGTFRREQRGRG